MLSIRGISGIAVSIFLHLGNAIALDAQIRGSVTDPSTAVIPGAVLQAKDTSTGLIAKVNSGDHGGFAFLSLKPGTYEVTATATGFQTAVFRGVVVATAQTTNLQVHLKVGQTTETIEVSDVVQVLQTSSNTIATTVRNDYIQNLPLNGRDTLQFALLMAGSQSIDSGRNSTFNGLPNASMNIAIDGINNNSQRFKSGGTSFFAYAPLRLDAIEETTITTTGAGADAAGEGAMTIRFTTRRGTGTYHWKVFEQMRNEALNANSFFNNLQGFPRARLRQNDVGGNFSGRLVPFVPYLKDRLFFFANFEATPQPSSQVSSVTVLTPDAQNGIYKYIGTDNQIRSVNVLQVARDRGIPTAIDPISKKMLDTINGTLSNGRLVPSPTDLNRQTLQWVQHTNSITYYPTARVDYRISRNLGWHGSWNLRWNDVAGVPNYPGLAQVGGSYKTTTYVATSAFDWTIRPTLINTFTIGVQSNGEYFYKETNIRQWAEFNDRRPHLGPITFNVADTIPNLTPFIRNNPVYPLYDNVNWVRGKHSFTFGGSLLKTSFWETSWGSAGVLDFNVGIAAGDPVSAALGASALPLVRTADVANAANLYAILTGRLSSISGSRNVDETTLKYQDFSPITQRFAFTTGSLYAQDSFRITRHLTLNYGLRWQIPGAIHNTNNINTPPDLANFYGPSKSLFRPGTLDGVLDPQLTVRPYTYRSDKINPAPNLGFAWNPKFDSGWRKPIFGDTTVIRASYGINYYDEGLNAVSNQASTNPGTTQSIVLNPGQPGFTPGGLNLSSSLPAFSVNPQSFSFPMPVSLFTFSGSLATTKPDLHTPYVQNWTFGIQRGTVGGAVVEVRYVGNRSTHIWHRYNVQETNIFENGFLQEFRNAQNNLRVSQAADGLASFADRRLPGQVALPIFDAAFGARGSQPALPAASGYASGAFITSLTQGTAGGLANSLAANNIYFCRMVGNTFRPCANLAYNAAGPYPINFFRPNPFANNLILQDDNGISTYNGLQIELRKQSRTGLSLTANYTLSKSLGDVFNASDQSATAVERTLRDHRLDKGPSPFDLRHVFQTYWTYSIPFGRGQKFNLTNPILNRVAGGWTIAGIHKVTSGRVYQLVSGRLTFNNLTESGVVPVGVTASDLNGLLTTYSDGPSRNLYFADRRLIGPDGRSNPQMLTVPATPGVFGSFLYLYGPSIFSTDMALLKTIPITERLRLGFQVEGLNVFNHTVFGNGTTPAATTINIDSPTFGQTTSMLIGPRNLQIRAYLQW